MDNAARSSNELLASAYANITADTMQANSKAGRALNYGHARLWQGDSVLEAESIELLRDTRVLNAAGNVRAVFPQAAPQAAETSSAGGQAPGVLISPSPKSAQTPPKKNFWPASSGKMTFGDKE